MVPQVPEARIAGATDGRRCPRDAALESSAARRRTACRTRVRARRFCLEASASSARGAEPCRTVERAQRRVVKVGQRVTRERRRRRVEVKGRCDRRQQRSDAGELPDESLALHTRQWFARADQMEERESSTRLARDVVPRGELDEPMHVVEGGESCAASGVNVDEADGTFGGAAVPRDRGVEGQARVAPR